MDISLEEFWRAVKERVKQAVKDSDVTASEIDCTLQEIKTVSIDDIQQTLVPFQDDMCALCGACCRDASPITLFPGELEKLAKHVGLEVEDVKRKYLIEPSSLKGYHNMRGKPCLFLSQSDNLCTLHNHGVKPYVCKVFPGGVLISEMLGSNDGVKVVTYCEIYKMWLVWRSLNIISQRKGITIGMRLK